MIRIGIFTLNVHIRIFTVPTKDDGLTRYFSDVK